MTDRLDDLALFISIVEKGGLAAGGREHGLAPASVSERLNRFERDYGARLLNRTTRSIGVTDAGRVLLEGARRSVAESRELQERVRLGTEGLSGPIRIGMPVDVGRMRLVPLLDRFMAEHPHIDIDLQLTDERTDLVASGLDLAIRHGRLLDSSLIVRTLAPSRRLVCASPAWFAANDTPRDPSELSERECLVMRFGGELDNLWPFEIDGRPTMIAVRGRRIANDGQQIREWCVAGHGHALKAKRDVAADIAAGRLATCLGEFAIEPAALQILYPSALALPRRVRRRIDHLVEAFAGE